MNRDEITMMAREIGMPVSEAFGPMVGACPVGDLLERFAALVRFDEREQCAKVCESLFDADDDSCNEAETCAAAIRARGQA